MLSVTGVHAPHEQALPATARPVRNKMGILGDSDQKPRSPRPQPSPDSCCCPFQGRPAHRSGLHGVTLREGSALNGHQAACMAAFPGRSVSWTEETLLPKEKRRPSQEVATSTLTGATFKFITRHQGCTVLPARAGRGRGGGLGWAAPRRKPQGVAPAGRTGLAKAWVPPWPLGGARSCSSPCWQQVSPAYTHNATNGQGLLLHNPRPPALRLPPYLACSAFVPWESGMLL